MGVLGRKAPQQLAGKITGIYIYLLGNSVWPLTAQNGPKRPVLGPFWGIAGRLRPRENLLLFVLPISALPQIARPQLLNYERS